MDSPELVARHGDAVPPSVWLLPACAAPKVPIVRLRAAKQSWRLLYASLPFEHVISTFEMPPSGPLSTTDSTENAYDGNGNRVMAMDAPNMRHLDVHTWRLRAVP